MEASRIRVIEFDCYPASQAGFESVDENGDQLFKRPAWMTASHFVAIRIQITEDVSPEEAVRLLRSAAAWIEEPGSPGRRK